MSDQIDNMSDRELLVSLYTRINTMFPNGTPPCQVTMDRLNRIERWAKGLGVAVVTVVGGLLGRLLYHG